MAIRNKEYLNNKIETALASNQDIDISVLREILGDMVDSDFNLEDNSAQTLQYACEFNEENVVNLVGFTNASVSKVDDDLTLVLTNDKGFIYNAPKIFDEDNDAIAIGTYLTLLSITENTVTIQLDMNGRIIDPDPNDTEDIYWVLRY